MPGKLEEHRKCLKETCISICRDNQHQQSVLAMLLNVHLCISNMKPGLLTLSQEKLRTPGCQKQFGRHENDM